jgi:hypothetical protein
MAAAPKSGTFLFKGLQSGRTYALDTYVSDVLAAGLNFDNGSGATSTSLVYWKCPENVMLYDWSIPTGLTDTTNVVLTSDGAQVPNSRLRHANFVNTLATRPALNIQFRQGSNFGAIQA